MTFAWNQLKKPFTVLAPMEDVTDTVFRQIVALVHKPDVMMTEFVSVEGLCSKGREMLLPKLAYREKDRPFIAQIWGVTPDNFFIIAKQIAGMGFDGIDINMGCPQKNIMKTGGGAALIDNPQLAEKIIRKTREGIQSAHSSIPLSVKTRIGNKRKNTEEWMRFLLSLGLDALTIHGRIAKDQSKRLADWTEIQKAVRIRDEEHLPTVIIGNGDVASYDQALRYSRIYGVDGVMVGRGIFQNINCFNPNGSTLSHDQLRTLLVKHLELFEATYGTKSHKYVMMKKFFKLYIRDFEGSVLLRERLMSAKTISEAQDIILSLPKENKQYG